ncbi:PIN domain-containing protein [Arthrobacter sp. TMS2-4]
MIFIVPDTNILHNDPLLAGEAWRSLDEHREEWAIQIAVPDVVEMETVRKVREKWTLERKPFDDARLGKFGLQDDVRTIANAITARIDSYEADLTERLAELGANVVLPSALNHLEIARRAAYSIAPYQRKTKDGYRDTVIWLTVMSIAEENPDSHVWFVSDNSQDFGPVAPNWTGENQGSRSDCPILFHSQLRKDLDARGLFDRVNYVTSLQTLEQHLASLRGPISDDDLAALVSGLDGSELSFLLEEQIKGQQIAPSQAALSLNTVSASIVSADSVGYTWHFSDSARRGQGRWTANFDINVEAYVWTRTYSGDAVMVSKLLNAGGRITFKESSEVESLEILSVKALPDDPNRSLWTAEAQHERIEATQLSLSFLKLLPTIDTSSWLPGINWAEVIGSQIDTTGMLPGFDFAGIAQHIDTSKIFGGVDLSNIASVQGVSDLIRAAGEIAQADDDLDDDLGDYSDDDSGVEKPSNSPRARSHPGRGHRGRLPS